MVEERQVPTLTTTCAVPLNDGLRESVINRPLIYQCDRNVPKGQAGNRETLSVSETCYHEIILQENERLIP